jgi:hypothetical protein
MDSPSSLRLIKVLRATLQGVEESGIVSPNGAELVHLRQRLVRAISELELQKGSPAPSEPKMPIVFLFVR